MTMTEEAEGIQLKVHQEPDGQVDSVTRIEWCINSATRQELVSERADDSQMLLVVTHGLKETDRYLLPLTATRWHVRFRYPGRNTVHATVVWQDRWYLRHPLKKTLLGRGKHGIYNCSVTSTSDRRIDDLYERTARLQRELGWLRADISREERKRPEVLEDLPDSTPEEDRQRREVELNIAALERELAALNGELEEADEGVITQLKTQEAAKVAQLDQLDMELAELEENPIKEIYLCERIDGVNRSQGMGLVEVDVPSTMFAKEPPRWMSWLGSVWDWPYPPRDQCQLRRRALSTLASLPFVGLGLAIIEVIDLIIIGSLLFAGMRHINYGVLRHPFREEPDKIWTKLGPSLWFHKRDTNTHRGYSPRNLAFLFLNPPVLTIFTVLGLLGWLLVGPVLLFVLAIALVFVLALFAMTGDYLAHSSVVQNRQQRADRRRAEEEARQAEALEEYKRRLEEISCGADQPSGMLASLPHERRVQYLYHATKALLCKPFAG